MLKCISDLTGALEWTPVPLLLVTLFVVVADQATKYAVGKLVAPHDVIPCFGGLVRITNVRNYGAAFGILQNKQVVFMAATVLVVLLGLFFLPRFPSRNWQARLGIALGIGGALGNFVDRVRFGSVFDFIEVSLWPVFNLADSAIVIGVALLMLGVLCHPGLKEE